MSTIVRLPNQQDATLPKRSYLNSEYGLKSWLLTGDHKRIAILYLISITFFFFLGGAFAGLIRLELLTPMPDLVASDTYNKLFTMHGIIMVFLFLVPSVPATIGNFVLPIMVGARDLAFPKVNLLSWYLYIVAGIFTVSTLVLGGVDTGWTFTTPLSTHYLNTHVITAAMGVFIAGFSSIFTGLNFIVTTHRMRAPGMTWFRLPLFVWSHYAASVLMVLGTPVLAITLVLVALERLFGIGVFDPAKGGDPILFQHLFWFYSHPAVYIMILPGSRRSSAPSAGSACSDIRRWHFRRWRLLCLGSSSGRTTCSSWVSPTTPRWSSRCSPCWSRCPRLSRSLTGRPPFIRARSPSRPRCSTPSASSVCSPSADLPASSSARWAWTSI
jgi:cytochrome c oxidase subunit 1